MQEADNMARKSALSRWLNRNPGKLFSIVTACFASLVTFTSVESFETRAIITADYCRADAYVGSGHYVAEVETSDGRTFRIGDKRNEFDPVAKREARQLTELVCTGEPIMVGVVHDPLSSSAEIVVAKTIS
ncbi:MAG: hypothetical protein CME88_14165 [Hirschia sp.]|nr:hypothetical protein [Hirschia sp.]